MFFIKSILGKTGKLVIFQSTGCNIELDWFGRNPFLTDTAHLFKLFTNLFLTWFFFLHLKMLIIVYLVWLQYLTSSTIQSFSLWNFQLTKKCFDWFSLEIFNWQSNFATPTFMNALHEISHYRIIAIVMHNQSCL